jgi:quinol-cytochrome oxidoreductase complex cytochrome b subunit
LLGFYYVLQVLSGLLLSSYYTATVEGAFESVTSICQQTKFGPLLRSIHANGASMIFILLYLHVGRGLYFRSYSLSRIPVWFSGVVILILMMATAFMGYVLPWGQMSYWGVTVITNLVTTIPLVGQDIHE